MWKNSFKKMKLNKNESYWFMFVPDWNVTRRSRQRDRCTRKNARRHRIFQLCVSESSDITLVIEGNRNVYEFRYSPRATERPHFRSSFIRFGIKLPFISMLLSIVIHIESAGRFHSVSLPHSLTSRISRKKWFSIFPFAGNSQVNSNSTSHQSD